MRMVPTSLATPALPISILLLPVVRLDPAPKPNAILLLPLCCYQRTSTVGCVLAAGCITKESNKPLAVLSSPVVLLLSAEEPLAVFRPPLVLLKSAERRGRVVGAGGITKERINTVGCVVVREDLGCVVGSSCVW